VRSWLAKQVLTRYMARLNAGDPRPLLRLDAKDIRFRFPGDSSWATELQGKAALARWLQRFVDAGLQIYPDEVVVKGPPWNMSICIRGTDHLDAPSGERVYENRYVIWGRIAWGLMREYEVYEDTQRSKTLDQYLLPLERAAATSAAPVRPDATAR
jgi:ketosteroid isomerase-like protein